MLCALYVLTHMASNLLTVLTRPELVFLRALGRCGVALWAHNVIRNTTVAHGCDPEFGKAGSGWMLSTSHMLYHTMCMSYM